MAAWPQWPSTVIPLKRLIRDVISTLAIAWLKRTPGLHLGAGVRMAGVPIIDIRNGATVHVGDGVVLNSLNYGYHANMFGRTKLFADRAGATIRIGARSRLHGTCVHAFKSITIGERCLFAANCQILDGNGHDASFPNVEHRLQPSDAARAVTIGDDVWLGLGVLVLPGVSIGQGAVVGAGSVVSRDIPPFSIAAGNPARVVRQHPWREREILDEAPDAEPTPGLTAAMAWPQSGSFSMPRC